MASARHHHRGSLEGGNYGLSSPAAPCGLPQSVELRYALRSPFAPPAKLFPSPNAPNAPWPAQTVFAIECAQPFADVPQ